VGNQSIIAIARIGSGTSHPACIALTAGCDRSSRVAQSVYILVFLFFVTRLVESSTTSDICRPTDISFDEPLIAVVQVSITE
jgi:hypothetical protein